jgi:aminopeptidase
LRFKVNPFISETYHGIVPELNSSEHATRLDRLAEVAIHVGLGLAPGQELVITANLDSVPLVRRITAQAYKAGASLVTTLLTDEQAALLRYENAPDESFDKAPGWLHDGIASAFRNGSARLAVAGGDPSLLRHQDPKKVSRANVALSKVSRPAMEIITRHEINWTIVASATPAWARAISPNEPEEVAMDRLWNAIFSCSRVLNDGAVDNWRQHDAQLQKRAAFLNQKRYSALHYVGPGTDLVVGLADDHLWLGGGTTAGNGLHCIPNMPTEEVFTTPHKDRVSGYVTASKPLSYQGMLIENIRVRFASGRIVEAAATAGQEVLQNLISTDDGACRLGEVALVPHSSPVSQSGLLFFNTLFDENAASHIALGQAYSSCIRDGHHMDKEALAAKGANDSLIHVDWMIGSDKINVFGVAAGGSEEPLMQSGEWL